MISTLTVFQFPPNNSTSTLGDAFADLDAPFVGASNEFIPVFELRKGSRQAGKPGDNKKSATEQFIIGLGRGWVRKVNAMVKDMQENDALGKLKVYVRDNGKFEKIFISGHSLAGAVVQILTMFQNFKKDFPKGLALHSGKERRKLDRAGSEELTLIQSVSDVIPEFSEMLKYMDSVWDVALGRQVEGGKMIMMGDGKYYLGDGEAQAGMGVLWIFVF